MSNEIKMHNSTVPNKAESSETLKDIKIEHSLKSSLDSDSGNVVKYMENKNMDTSESMSILSSEFNEHQDSSRSSEYNVSHNRARLISSRVQSIKQSLFTCLRSRQIL